MAAQGHVLSQEVSSTKTRCLNKRGPQCDFSTFFHVVSAFWHSLIKPPRIMQNHSASAGSRTMLRILWFLDSEFFL